MKYKFIASERYWKNFYALPENVKDVVRERWRLFKENPFHPKLGTHKIHALSARAGCTVYSVVIAEDLRVVFLIKGNTVQTIDIGSHKIYK